MGRAAQTRRFGKNDKEVERAWGVTWRRLKIDDWTCAPALQDWEGESVSVRLFMVEFTVGNWRKQPAEVLRRTERSGVIAAQWKFEEPQLRRLKREWTIFDADKHIWVPPCHQTSCCHDDGWAEGGGVFRFFPFVLILVRPPLGYRHPRGEASLACSPPPGGAADYGPRVGGWSAKKGLISGTRGPMREATPPPHSLSIPEGGGSPFDLVFRGYTWRGSVGCLSGRRTDSEIEWCNLLSGDRESGFFLSADVECELS